MKNAQTLFACAMVSLMVSACAGGATFTELNQSLKPTESQKGRIFFYRPSSVGAAVQPNVLLNGEKVGDAKPWGYFYVDRPPGKYEVMTTTEVERKLSFILEEGQTRFVRLVVSMGFFVGHIYGELVNESVGLEEIKDLSYVDYSKKESY